MDSGGKLRPRRGEALDLGLPLGQTKGMIAPLANRTVVVPESRELDLFSRMLEQQGAAVVRCPLVKVRPLDDFVELDAWIGRVIDGEASDVVFYTGEGVNHITARAETLNRRSAWTTALSDARRIVRGPKPIAALRRLGLAPDHSAGEPTTEGLLALLSGLDLKGRKVAVQLYPTADDGALRRLIEEGGGEYDPVTPYRYASDEEDRRVAEVIGAMTDGRVDLIAFTSSPQVRRLSEVAGPDMLATALQRTRIAAVGPVVAEAVHKAGGTVSIQPAANFHLKPLVNEIVRALA